MVRTAASTSARSGRPEWACRDLIGSSARTFELIAVELIALELMALELMALELMALELMAILSFSRHP